MKPYPAQISYFNLFQIPNLDYSTYLGGSHDDVGVGIAIDASGNAYVMGFTLSPDFPVISGLQSQHNGGRADAFVSKLDANGRHLVYSTYLGGTRGDSGFAIAVDEEGDADVLGNTAPSDFQKKSTYQELLKQPYDAFVAKLYELPVITTPAYPVGGSSDEEINPAVAYHTDGDEFLVAYRRKVRTDPKPLYELRVRCFDKSGQPLGLELG